MTKSNGSAFARSLTRLCSAVELATRLAEQSGITPGRVNVLCERLRRARSKLDAHRKSQPLEKRIATQYGDEIMSGLVELLTIVEAGQKKRG